MESAPTRPLSLFSQFVADERGPRAAGPAYFGARMYPQQAAVVARALEMEQTRVLPFVRETKGAFGMPPAPYCVEFDAGSIRCPFGSGKTVVVCALVASRTLPRPAPAMFNLVTRPMYDGEKVMLKVDASAGLNEEHSLWFSDTRVPPVLLERHTPRAVPATLVIVSSGVFDQWLESVERFVPGSTCFAVTGRAAMVELARMVSTGEAAKLDMVIVKTGTMSMEFDGHRKQRVVPDGSGGVRASVHVTYLLPRMLPVTWARLVLDDFDTLAVPSSAVLPVAHFTWYVSATRRPGVVQCITAQQGDLQKDEVQKYAMSRFAPGTWPMTAAASDDVVMVTLAVNSPDTFKDALPAPDYTVYRFMPAGALKLLSGVIFAPKLIEAVSSGAPKFVGGEVGTVCRTDAEVVLAVLSTESSKFRVATHKREALKAVRRALCDRAADGLEGARRVSAGALRRACADINRGWLPTSSPLPPSVPDCATLEDGTNFFENATEKFSAKLEEAIKTHGRTLDRLRENMQDGDCQVCLLPYGDCHTPQDSATYIMNCCQIVVCPVCVRGGDVTASFVAHCPHCRRAVAAETVIRLDASVDLAAVQNVTHERAIDVVLEEGAAAPAPPADAKMGGLLELLAGRAPACSSTSRGAAFDHLVGAHGPYVPADAHGPRKVLVFASLRESAARIRRSVEETGIPAPVLGGTSSKKSSTVSQFRNSRAPLAVLVVTGVQDSAGVHMPEVTDVVFFHRVWCTDVGSQLVGRAQRPGRAASLRVHQFVYAGLEEGPA